MKKIYIFLVLLFLTGGVFGTPFFVLANEFCLVGGSDDGASFYSKISEAIEADCSEIFLFPGTYSEDLTIKKNIKLSGKNREEVIIEGKIFVDDGVEIDGVTLTKGGVELLDGANVLIEKSIIRDSITTGLITNGGGKLNLYNTVITGNKKGLYAKAGKEIKVIGCEVYGNGQEGLDIRADTTGVVAYNKINSNRESGIEIILGATEMDIFGNELNNNESSGIAVQYYMESTELGNVKIRDNSMLKNGNYGLDCRTPSGGDGRPKGYYMNSLLMGNNDVLGNEKKEISSFCKFDDSEIIDITRDKETREKEILGLQRKKEKINLTELENKKFEELNYLNQREQEIKGLNEETENELEKIFSDLDQISERILENKNKIESRKKWKVFLIGEDYQEIEALKGNILAYEKEIKLAREIRGNFFDKDLIIQTGDKIKSFSEKEREFDKFVLSKGNEFSLLGFFLKKKV